MMRTNLPLIILGNTIWPDFSLHSLPLLEKKTRKTVGENLVSVLFFKKCMFLDQKCFCFKEII
ncbi:hypothetical protein HanXRQr2_Chr11g0497211 [Helianthus annuus]|uniref:Uncharacterized protein n=1 Tax=Helianthus annuus TaxID=4232 RepID=A0A9K3N0L6_HELAN|nr:hypothetical protein HanXRQr2_Chr11g0497211 [Helianthus annuus]KAJ0875682.1 hypothetical protein HanPSC8_Chr11g0479241 [Helianthus annuus]